MPLKTAPSQLKAVHNYYIRNTEAIKLRRLLSNQTSIYYLKNCEEIKRKRRERYARRKLQIPTLV
jgi:hypothetical protein